MKPRARERTRGGNGLDVLTHGYGLRYLAATITSANHDLRIFFALSKEVDTLAQVLVLAFHDQMRFVELAASVLTLRFDDLVGRQPQTTSLNLHEQRLAILDDLRMKPTLETVAQMSPNTVRHKEPL